VVEQDYLLAHLAVGQADPAWKIGVVHDHAGHASRFKLRIVELEQGGEGFWLQAFDSVGHGQLFTLRGATALPDACAQSNPLLGARQPMGGAAYYQAPAPHYSHGQQLILEL
jgi:hypothetical protein